VRRLGIAAIPLCLALATSLSCGSHSGLPSSPGGLLWPDHARLGPGKTQQFGTRLDLAEWRVEGPAGSGIISNGGLYHAPYFQPAGGQVEVAALSPPDTARAAVTITDGPADPRDCCGPGQDHLPAHGEYLFADELPVAVVRVPPSYPDSAREAGVDGTVVVNALVCADGQIIETWIASSIPLLDGAAADAVRKWVFLPARKDGQPIAVWVAVPVKFSLH